MNDLISRQAAIDAFEGEVEVTGLANAVAVRGYANLVLDRILRLPSAEPERKTGRWIVDNEYIDCSVCRREKWSRVPYESLVRRFRYCPNCGADMRGESDETETD